MTQNIFITVMFVVIYRAYTFNPINSFVSNYIFISALHEKVRCIKVVKTSWTSVIYNLNKTFVMTYFSRHNSRKILE